MAISFSERAEVTCPRCGRLFSVSVWRLVDAVERPDLRALILLGRLNWFHCPSCGSEGEVPLALLYHDADHEAVLLALPPGQLEEPAVRAQADPLVEALQQAIPPEKQRPYLYNVQVAGSLAGLADEVRSWGGGSLVPGS